MYTSEVNCQIVISLLKAHGIKRVVASPGSTNVAFVGSIQNDPWFEIYSAVDERHAAYMAVGMAEESGEPVVISCTGATASRNYLSALTEAYYRKLPVLAVTSSQVFTHLGNLYPQMIDRTQIQKDVARVSVWCPVVKDEDTKRYCELEVNRAILELSRHGGGPAHIDLETSYSGDFTVPELPKANKIERYSLPLSDAPTVGQDKKVAIWIGAHRRFSQEESVQLEKFFRTHRAVALVTKESGYFGYGAISAALLTSQWIRDTPKYAALKPDLIVHLGEMNADYFSAGYLDRLAPVWRVSEDGEIRDRLGRCEIVFEMPEAEFFNYQNRDLPSVQNDYFEAWERADEDLRRKLPDIPFSNNWIARTLGEKLPPGSALHLGILSTVRSWSFLHNQPEIESYCNSGGFGIDGNLSSLIGGSIVKPDKLHFGMVGDLSFFYDMNALGNRHVGTNLRLAVVNNGLGAEFTMYGQAGAQFGDRTADYISAGGHFGAKSAELVKHYVEDLGMTYLCAHTKDEFNMMVDRFVSKDGCKSIVLECFVDAKDEVIASEKMSTIENAAGACSSLGCCLPHGLKSMIRKVIRK